MTIRADGQGPGSGGGTRIVDWFPFLHPTGVWVPGFIFEVTEGTPSFRLDSGPLPFPRSPSFLTYRFPEAKREESKLLDPQDVH